VGAVARPLLIAIAVVVLVAVVRLWLVMVSRAMDFAGASGLPCRVPPGSVRRAVPAELASAVSSSGVYLTRARLRRLPYEGRLGEPLSGAAVRAAVRHDVIRPTSRLTRKGIGEYSDAHFLRAMACGIARDGTRLYPAMPYASYT